MVTLKSKKNSVTKKFLKDKLKDARKGKQV